jgi:hypothetical protein
VLKPTKSPRRTTNNDEAPTSASPVRGGARTRPCCS